MRVLRRWVRAVPRAKMAGWAYWVVWRSSAWGVPGWAWRMSRRGWGRWGVKASVMLSMAWA